MRMSCDSTYLVDQQTRHDTKISELFYILEERLAEPEEKVVVFSQWERMTRIVSQELEEREVEFAYLHGGVPSNKRGDLLDRFRDDDNCRVFSPPMPAAWYQPATAALVVNLDIPWNPAVLEQRIARIFRLGQKRQVQVINLISGRHHRAPHAVYPEIQILPRRRAGRHGRLGIHERPQVPWKPGEVVLLPNLSEVLQPAEQRH